MFFLRFFSFLCFFLSFTLAHAQYLDQRDRVEIETEYSDNDFNILPAGSFGVLVFREKDEKPNRQQSEWVFEFYGTDFNKKWTKSYFTSDNNYCREYVFDYKTRKAFFLFGTRSDDEGEFVMLDPETGVLEKVVVAMVPRFSVNSMSVLNSGIYMEGIYRGKVTLGYIDLLAKKFTLIPITFKGKYEVQAINADTLTGQANAVFRVVYQNKKYINIKTFNEGKVVQEVNIDPKAEDKFLISGRSSVVSATEKFVIGTYSNSIKASAIGFYIAKVTNGTQEFIKYYNFIDFNSFASRVSAKQMEKIEKKAAKKEKEGKEYGVNYNLLVHDIEKQNDQYLLLAEAYIPTYRTEYYQTYVAGTNGAPGRYVTTTRRVFDGWLYTHAFVGGFNDKGEMIWDNSVDMGEFKSFVLKQRVRVHKMAGDRLQLVYAYGNQVYSAVINQSTVVAGKQTLSQETNLDNDIVKWSNTSIDYWYDRYFISWGYQRIKNKEEETQKRKRTVFYFNKISY